MVNYKLKMKVVSEHQRNYDIGKNKLNVDGLIVADRITTEGKFKCEGSVYKRIIKTDSPNYVVADDDYTILCDTVKNKVTVELPPACNNNGRILIIKKVNTDKYSIKSEPIDIVAKDSIIDRKDVMVIKMNYSSRMLQSDGENWWSIGLSGT
jgi:hypothetical protein